MKILRSIILSLPLIVVVSAFYNARAALYFRNEVLRCFYITT